MVLETNFLTLIVVLAFAAILAYQIPFLNRKTIGYLSLLQIFYLVILPGIAYTFAYAYLQSLLQRPLNKETVLPDGLLVNSILLALLFTYGGLAIHAVTKMLSEVESLRYKKSEAHAINKYFHLTFSHNLIFCGGMLTIICFTLLELNHTAPQNHQSLTLAVFKGIILGLSFIGGMYRYTLSKDNYMGRWSDLKAVFLVFWLGSILIFYAIIKTDPSFREYQLLLPVLLSFIVIGLLNIVLVFRHFRRGGVSIYFRWGRIKQKIWESDNNQEEYKKIA